jgi:tetratricopeptide (TPR) repeat protein
MNENRTRQRAEKWAAQGERLMASAAWADALDAFDRAIAEDTGMADAYLGRGACHYKLGHFRQAATDMDAATLLGCEDAQLWSRFCPRDVDLEEEDDEEEDE